MAGWLAASALAWADEQMIEEYDGHNSLTTSDFRCPTGWEIRWTSEQVLSIGVIELDHTVIAGTTGHDIGSLFVPQGGHYRLVVQGADPIPWDIKVYALGPVVPPDDSRRDHLLPAHAGARLQAAAQAAGRRAHPYADEYRPGRPGPAARAHAN